VALRDDFPDLDAEGFSQTSPATEDYNCIAWAAGRQDDWWWPDPGFVSYWPEEAPRVETLDAFYAAFALLGYERCNDGRRERGFDKVAFYARDGRPKHAARQLPDGLWTSKLGENLDISHTLRGLEGPWYGQVAGYLRRPLQQHSVKNYQSSRVKITVAALAILVILAALFVLTYLSLR